jgi:hypothetical protein
MPWRVPLSDSEALYNLPKDLEEGQVCWLLAIDDLSFMRLLSGPLVRSHPWQTVFVTVRATNGAGLHTTVTGLGVAIDFTAPIGGSVHDGAGTRDIDYQARCTVYADIISSSVSISLSLSPFPRSPCLHRLSLSLSLSLFSLSFLSV